MSKTGPSVVKASGSSHETGPELQPSTAEPLSPVGLDPDALAPTTEIEVALNRTISSVLNFTDWERGASFAGLAKAQEYLATSIQDQRRILRGIRKKLLPELASFNNAPAEAGVYRPKEEDLRIARRSVLLSGRMTAVRGASIGHDSLAASLVSVGVSTTRYDGQIRSWRTFFMRHDCDIRTTDPVEEIRKVLDREARLSTVGPGARGGDTITRLMRRAFQSAAERKCLLERGGPGWRMGYGVPAPYELLTGSGSMGLIDAVLPVLEDLLLAERRWVFVPDSLSSRAFTGLAGALQPGELAIFQKAKPTLDAIVDRGHYDSASRAKVKNFVNRAGEAIVIGGFRATPYAPPQLFFAHTEHALHAGVVAMADAEFQPHRGFPLLLELAGMSCSTALGIDAFRSLVESTYASTGASGLYSSAGVILPELGE
jgi:hypothetical protein